MWPCLFMLVPGAHAADLRLTVEITAEGIDVLGFDRGPRSSRGRIGPVPGGLRDQPLMVRSAEGEVLARVVVPDARLRSLSRPDGAGVSVLRGRAVTTVDVPWPVGAAYITGSDGRRWDPPGPIPGPTPAPGATAVRLSGTGSSDERLDLVIVSEGYTAAELPDFQTDAQAVVDYLALVEPWARYSDGINIWRVDMASAVSGAAADVSTPIDTAFSCYYGCADKSRLICCDDDDVLAAVEAALPASDGILVLVNHDLYGGSGSFNYAVSYNGPLMLEVAGHELGHSLFSLGDEYEYFVPDPATNVYPNCSQDAAGGWDLWIGYDGVDSFAGCGYDKRFRPRDDACTMRNQDSEFCPVCLEYAVTQVHTALPGLVSSLAPEPSPHAVVVVSAADTTTTPAPSVSVSTTLPAELLEFTWTLDGAALSEDGPDLVLDCSLGAGELMLTVRDPTPWVRAYTDFLDEDHGPWTVDDTMCHAVDPPDDDDKDPGDCGCASGGPSAAWLLVAAGLLWARQARNTAWACDGSIGPPMASDALAEALEE